MLIHSDYITIYTCSSANCCWSKPFVVFALSDFGWGNHSNHAETAGGSLALRFEPTISLHRFNLWSLCSFCFYCCNIHFWTFLCPQERSSYLEYQKLMREIQHLSRLYVAWLFVCAEETKLKSAENLKVMQDNIAKMQASMAENESKVQELTAQIQELQKKKDQVLYTGEERERFFTIWFFFSIIVGRFCSTFVEVFKIICML